MVHDAIGLMESRLDDAGFGRVAGADEVGRGALAGPLVAAAVILPADISIPGLRDSKMCTRLQRERLAEQIKEQALSFAVVRVAPGTIDREGLNPANIKALRRALNNLGQDPDYVIVDAFKIKRLRWPNLAVKKGDAVSKCVAAASIIAKVHRDAAMRRYHRRFKQYGFATNVGYGTREHWNALIRFGPSEIHRRSFYGVDGFVDEDGVFRPHRARNWEDQAEPLEGDLGER
jgi:ribonuclease HII